MPMVPNLHKIISPDRLLAKVAEMVVAIESAFVFMEYVFSLEHDAAAVRLKMLSVEVNLWAVFGRDFPAEVLFVDLEAATTTAVYPLAVMEPALVPPIVRVIFILERFVTLSFTPVGQEQSELSGWPGMNVPPSTGSTARGSACHRLVSGRCH